MALPTILVAVFGALWLATVIWGEVLRRIEIRRTATALFKTEYYSDLLFEYVFGSGPAPELKHKSDLALVGNILETMCLMCNGYDRRRVNDIVLHYNLGDFLRRKARQGNPYQKALCLRQLSLLGCDAQIAESLSEFEDSSNEYVRSYTLLARINHSPECSIAAIQAHPYPLTPISITEIITQLRRGYIPIAYEPMIMSSNNNLVELGLGIIRHFRINDALPTLYRLASTTAQPAIESVLVSIVTLHGNLAKQPVTESISQLPRNIRKKLYRHVTTEGYSLSALAEVCSNERNSSLGGYLDELAGSYKRTLSL